MKQHSKQKRIMVLGSTGSIGGSTLDVIRRNSGMFSVAALSCHHNTQSLLAQIREFKPEAVCATDPAAALPAGLDGCRLYKGSEGLLSMIRETGADMVVHGISGTQGLLPSFASIQSGKGLALANKETVVMAGGLLFKLALKHQTVIIPVDSEHSALFHLLRKEAADNIKEIVLTASGGALRDLPPNRFADVTIEDVLKHPNWKMGAKITVDSATMANKALEVIEAHHFFNIEISKIKVVIHPQSFVHSLIKTIEGSFYAQISKPDMRLPIQNALTYPELCAADYGSLDLDDCRMTFKAVDPRRYPMLALGYRAAGAGGAYPIAYNAANEAAVRAFLASKIRFTDIAYITEKILALDWGNLVNSVDEILHVNEVALNKATALIERRTRE
jgi:1-deoxy-D-xylulose-5-phosphate reductoisomerase